MLKQFNKQTLLEKLIPCADYHQAETIILAFKGFILTLFIFLVG